MDGRDITGEILAASFWQNWIYAKELSRERSPKSQAQFLAAENIRKEWIDHQQKQKENAEVQRLPV